MSRRRRKLISSFITCICLIIYCLIRLLAKLFVMKTIQMVWFILTLLLLFLTILTFKKENSKYIQKIIFFLLLIIFLFFCVRWNGDITDFLVSIKQFPSENTLTTNKGNIVMLYNDTLNNLNDDFGKGLSLFNEYIIGSNRYLRKKYKRDIIQNIKIIDLNHEQEPKDYYDKWDISKARNKSVMLWLVKNENNSEMYDMYIGAKGKIILSEGYEFFANYINCKNIDGLDNLDTRYIKSCSSMFANLSKLKELDLSTFDTRNVTTLAFMFENCSNLEKLNLNNFDTQYVTNLTGTFKNCNNLKELEIDEWNTKNVYQMDSTFFNCANLKNLDLQNWDISNVERIDNVFLDCENLEYISFPVINTLKAKTYWGYSSIVAGSTLKIIIDEQKNEAIIMTKEEFYKNYQNISKSELLTIY